MKSRRSISIWFCCLGILSLQAQNEKKDSLQQKENEIYINQEAVKSIEFNFMPQNEIIKEKPMMDESKPWMKFRKELPINLRDTITQRKKKHIRMLPYSIWGQEKLPEYLLDKDTLNIRMKLNTDKIKSQSGMENGYRVLPHGMDQSVTPSNNPATSFDADKVLFETFTKRGRAIRRNREKAKTWKIYKDYVPTKEDSIKWNKNKKRTPKDTLAIPVDSTNHHFINTK